MTKSDWPVLVNLGRAAQIGYQQVAKFDSKTRVVASAWEQEIVLAECADGREARAMVDRIAQAMGRGTLLLDLRRVDLASGAE